MFLTERKFVKTLLQMEWNGLAWKCNLKRFDYVLKVPQITMTSAKTPISMNMKICVPLYHTHHHQSSLCVHATLEITPFCISCLNIKYLFWIFNQFVLWFDESQMIVLFDANSVDPPLHDQVTLNHVYFPLVYSSLSTNCSLTTSRSYGPHHYEQENPLIIPTIGVNKIISCLLIPPPLFIFVQCCCLPIISHKESYLQGRH